MMTGFLLFVVVPVLALATVALVRRVSIRHPLFDPALFMPAILAINIAIAVSATGVIPALCAITASLGAFFHVRSCRRLTRLRNELADIFGERSALEALRRVLIVAAAEGSRS